MIFVQIRIGKRKAKALNDDGKQIGSCTISICQDYWTIDHTFVDPEFRGQNIASIGEIGGSKRQGNGYENITGLSFRTTNSKKSNIRMCFTEVPLKTEFKLSGQVKSRVKSDPRQRKIFSENS